MELLGKSSEEISKDFKEGKITVAVFGLGKMGMPLAAVFADRGSRVIGVDINEDVVEQVNNGVNHVKEEPGLKELVEKNVEEGRLTATTDGVGAAREADVCVILVPTLTDEKGNVKMGPVLDVTETISQGLEKGNVVITEATMPPGNTEKLVPILEKSGLELGEFGLGHAPERTMTGTAIRDIKGQYPKIIGADSDRTLEVLKGIYEVINEKGVVEMDSIISAEAVKVFEGIYRDVNIALANELARYCEERDINALDTIEAANTQTFCNLHEPGAGVAGHCIPVYPWFVINQSDRDDSKLLRTARKINDSMPYHIVDLVVKGLNEVERAVKGSNILVLGLTFRGGVKEFMKTPAEPVISKLNELGANTFAFDPMCDEEDARRYGAEWKDDFEGIDAVVILTDHEEFETLDLEKIGKTARNELIVDGRNVLDPEDVKGNGFTYLRVGY
ncbi:MAG: nucleotide sugar dehydrogenase [Candidatus Saliniplasma sp.]